MDDQSIFSSLTQRGVTRRQFIKFCGAMAAALALPPGAALQIADALAASPRPRVIWLEFQGCTADTESFLRAVRQSDPLQPNVSDPDITALLLDVLSVDYHETLMVPAGALATKSRDDVVRNYPGQYLCVVEGSIPAGNNSGYCAIGGRSAQSIAQEVCGKAKGTIALGTCAWTGGLSGAKPNPTGALGVAGAVPGLKNLVNLPGCPCNAVSLVATIVYFITYNKWPALDAAGVPTFASGSGVIHDNCPRQEFYNQNKFVYAWGDQGHRQGWCLYVMGCRGPVTRNNCPTVLWNGRTSWCVQAGHGCVGCSTSKFWDQNTPFYTTGPAPATTPAPTATSTPKPATAAPTTKPATTTPTKPKTATPTRPASSATPKPPSATPTNTPKPPSATPTKTPTR